MIDSVERAGKLSRTDLIAYFVETLQGLEPKLRKKNYLIEINNSLEGLLASLGGYEPESENSEPKKNPFIVLYIYSGFSPNLSLEIINFFLKFIVSNRISLLYVTHNKTKLL